MKLGIAVAVFLTSLSLWAQDMSRPILTNNLNCTGVLKGKKPITLQVKASPNKTQLVLQEKGGARQQLLNHTGLKVGSEGNIYIQQVSNELGYNLYLTGPGLKDVLYGSSPKLVRLTGSLNLFRFNLNYSLRCQGTLY